MNMDSLPRDIFSGHWNTGHCQGIAVDLALQGGKRISESKGNWEEVFLGVRLGLMGIGSWGQSRR